MNQQIKTVKKIKTEKSKKIPTKKGLYNEKNGVSVTDVTIEKTLKKTIEDKTAEWVFVTPNGLFGEIKVYSDFLKRDVILKHTGSWIPIEDLDALLERKQRYFCIKRNMWSEASLVYLGEPTAKQLKNKPKQINR